MEKVCNVINVVYLGMVAFASIWVCVMMPFRMSLTGTSICDLSTERYPATAYYAVIKTLGEKVLLISKIINQSIIQSIVYWYQNKKQYFWISISNE